MYFALQFVCVCIKFDFMLRFQAVNFSAKLYIYFSLFIIFPGSKCGLPGVTNGYTSSNISLDSEGKEESETDQSDEDLEQGAADDDSGNGGGKKRYWLCSRRCYTAEETERRKCSHCALCG